MIIKKEEKKNKEFFSKFTVFLYFYFLTSLVGLSFLIIAIFQSQLFIQKKNKFLDYFSKAGRYEYLYLPKIFYKAVKSNFYKLENIDLEISFKNMIILENLRNESILDRQLPPADKMPKVKTKIIYEGKKFDSDIRLKGDRIVHFNNKNKSSYKLELDKDQFLFGMKKFSLQKPRLRNYVHEWIFHELSKNEGLIKIKYNFINLSFNGDDMGLYVIEEGFGKELIERNKRRNGPIFGINEDVYGLYDKPVFEIYNKKYWKKPENNLILNIASQKLHDFFQNKVELNDVFDLDKWAAYFAIIDLTATYHGALLKSVKLYYNPINGLFEPIPYDGHRLKPNYHKYNLNYDNRILIDIVQNPIGDEISGYTWLKKFFYKGENINQNFYNLYSEYLNKVSSKKYIDDFLTKNLKKIEKINSHIYADYFFYDNSRNYGVGLYYFLLSDFEYHAENIRDKLKLQERAQLLKIDNKNYLFKPFYKNYNKFIAKKLNCSNKNNFYNFDLSKNINNFNNTNIILNNQNPDIVDDVDFKCNYLILFDEFSNQEISLKVDHLNSKFYYENFNKKNFENFKNFFVEVKNNTLNIKYNSTEIDMDVYIPKGYKVIIKPGQELILTNNAFIISNSPWLIDGKDQEVKIFGKADDPGGGILIGDTQELSKISNTKFSFLSGYNFKKNYEHIILGSINFHQTNVEVNNVTFENILSEDAINIFRSKFKIHDVKYKNIFSDAIDIDFSEGEIKNVNFADINNDAIDFSGSIVTVNNAYFENINDKLISAGEESIINIDQIKGKNSFAGVISKDGSKVYTQNIDFKDVKVPFAAYQKKNEYNYPFLEAKNFKISNFLTKPIKDSTAELIYDDEIVTMKLENIISLMYEKNLSLIEKKL